MSKLTINLILVTEFLTFPTLNSVKVNAVSVGTINYLSKTVALTGLAEDISIPAIKANTKYSSVMLPQTMGDIIIKIGDEIYKYSSDPSIVLTSNKNNTLNLTLGKDGLFLLNFSITYWATETSIGEIIIVK